LKPLNTLEIDALVSDCATLIGAEAQDFHGDLDCMVLKLWSSGLKYLVFQIKGESPLFFHTDDKADLNSSVLKRPDQKPFFIFYKTHFKNAKLIRISRLLKYGRLTEFTFLNEMGEELILEFRLFPRGVNLGLKLGSNKGGKSVYLKKPQELIEFSDDYQPESIRSPEVIKDEWIEKQEHEKKSNLKSKNSLDQQKKKQEEAMKKILSALSFLKTSPHQRFAELLQDQKKLTEDLKGLYRENMTERENIEWGFAQHKENELKIERLKERVDQLSEASKAKSLQKLKNNKSGSADLKAARHLTLSKEVRAFCGRTATENLDLLRKSKSWHLWMHLKDYPSGHLILTFPKNHQVSEEELQKSALFLFKVAAPKKLHASERVSFEVIFTETKFVKPIKGAKKGLVQPSRTKSRIFLWNKSENLSF
jgi:hypothetical protein